MNTSVYSHQRSATRPRVYIFSTPIALLIPYQPLVSLLKEQNYVQVHDVNADRVIPHSKCNGTNTIDPSSARKKWTLTGVRESIGKQDTRAGSIQTGSDDASGGVDLEPM